MIECPGFDLRNIYQKLSKIVLFLNPSESKAFSIPTQQNILSNIKTIVQKLFNDLVESKKNPINNAQSHSDMYAQIQNELQKQEQLNRHMIKKQLQFKEYQKCLEDELRTERSNTKKLQNRLDKFNEKIVSKDMEILFLANQRKVLTKQRKVKDTVTIDSPFTDKKPPQGLKVFNKDPLTHSKVVHKRGKSDDIFQPVQGLSKRRMSVSRR